MKVLIVACGKAAMTWEKAYNSDEFNEISQRVIDCDVETIQTDRISSNGRPVYVSSAKSATQTAELLFTDADIIVEQLLNEVSVCAYKNTAKKLPLWRWQLMASMQRFFGNSRQSETKAQAKIRADKLLDLLEAKNQDCILISHPIFIKILLDRFSARGYCITGRNTVRIAPLNRLLITKWDMHCGGCGHNCLLSNPGCGVGRDAGKRRVR